MSDLRKSIKKSSTPKWGPVDPIDLFRWLKIKPSSSIKEMWAPQADALREWHARRQNPDVLFQLNTGAGKTLIGLIAAQSIVNETRGKVVYCCATNQLVEQTRSKAQELGIPSATYMSGEWDEQETYVKAHGPVLTNYAALFNGKNIFTRDALSSVIFDDAHTAHDSIRSAYSLRIERQDYPDVYETVVSLMKDYFDSVRRGYQFAAVTERRDKATVIFVPTFEVVRHAKVMQQVLLANGVESEKKLLFSWAHLGPQLDRCALLIDAGTVEFTPLLPPLHTHRALRKDVRRLYLSATLRVSDEFVRTFGRAADPVISPGGRAGDTQRLFLFPPPGMIDEAARSWAEEATRKRKAVIMVPSWPAANRWETRADIFSSEDGHDRIRQFAKSSDERLVFVARYDGIDLPDEDCRLMVVDGIPGGLSLLDRFFEGFLERAAISDAKIASRFVQLLGRTSRGMSDYGAVLLVGRRLLEWVLPPVHRALLPRHIQRQLSVGEILTESGHSAKELIDKCLLQTADWVQVYEEEMERAQEGSPPQESETERALRLAWAERKGAEALWDDHPDRAVQVLSTALPEATKTEAALGAWFAHWIGQAFQRAGDQAAAEESYREAARIKPEMGGMPGSGQYGPVSDSSAYSEQAARMAALLAKDSIASIERKLTTVAKDLRNDGASANVHEEALRMLGQYLAFDAWRGDLQTAGKAHDDVWEEPGGMSVLLFDAKTKKGLSRYSKEYIGQAAQHALWAEKKYPNAQRLYYIVGPRVPATPQATPPAGLRIVAKEEMARLAESLQSVYVRAAASTLPLFRAAEIEVGLKGCGLTWSDLPMSMETIRLDSILDS